MNQIKQNGNAAAAVWPLIGVAPPQDPVLRELFMEKVKEAQVSKLPVKAETVEVQGSSAVPERQGPGLLGALLRFVSENANSNNRRGWAD